MDRATIILASSMLACTIDGVSTTISDPGGANTSHGGGGSTGGIGDVDTGIAATGHTTEGLDGPDDAPVLDVGLPGGGDTEADACPCVGTGEGIDPISETSELWTFDPATEEFELLGEVSCPTDGEFQAMALDCQGHVVLAYVEFGPAGVSIETFSLELDDLSSCAPVDLELPTDRLLGGMGHASADSQDACDDLYVFALDAQSDAPGTAVLARIDQAAAEYVELGPVPYEQAQLTGTGDGRLFGFAGDTNEASLVGFDKDDAHVIESETLPGLDAVNGLGFAFWGGDVWFFTDSAQHDTSLVTRLDYDGNEGGGSTVVVDETPARFLGAGVSTCVPSTPQG